MNTTPISTGSYLAGLMSCIVLAGSANATEKASPQTDLGLAEFFALDIASFKVEKLGLEAAVGTLREIAEKQTGFKVPPVGIIRYREDVQTQANPWGKEEVISLDLHHESVADILRWTGELAGFQMLAQNSSIGLYQLPGFYHPRPVITYDLKKIIAAKGKPDKPVMEWLIDMLEKGKVPHYDLGIHERNGQVFIVMPPEYAWFLLKPRVPVKK